MPSIVAVKTNEIGYFDVNKMLPSKNPEHYL